MNYEVIKFIFLFLLGTTVINFAIALTARIKTGNKEFTLLVFYWTSLFLTYFAVSALNGSPTEIAFAYFFQFIPAFLKTKVVRDARKIKSNWTFFLVFQLLSSLLSAYLLLKTDLGFTISLLPVTIGVTLPYWSPIWSCLSDKGTTATWIEKGLAFVLLTSVVNHFNYAFFRLDTSTAWWGWSVSIAQYQCISIFLPLLINQRREEKERKNLQLALEKMAGKNKNVTTATEDLYIQLQTNILQKEELLHQLKSSNANLEEEREINDILIKTISHDLANPLTVIGAYVDLMTSGKIAVADSKKTLIKVQNNTNSALNMISRIRKAILNRSQADLVSIEPVNLKNSLNRLFDVFENKLLEKNIKLNYINELDHNVFVEAEENALTEHVFANILSNSIKFSFENSQIDITVKDHQDYIRVSFKDYGTGIEESRLKKRLLSSTDGTNGESGTGFGIMVMTYFLKKFNAVHTLTSQNSGENTGTTVSIDLKKSHTQSDFILPKTSEATANIYS